MVLVEIVEGSLAHVYSEVPFTRITFALGHRIRIIVVSILLGFRVSIFILLFRFIVVIAGRHVVSQNRWTVAMAVPMVAFHQSHALLDNEKCQNTAQHPRAGVSVRMVMAIVTVSVVMSMAMRMRLQGMRNQMQKSVAEEATAGEAQQNFEQRFVFAFTI